VAAHPPISRMTRREGAPRNGLHRDPCRLLHAVAAIRSPRALASDCRPWTCRSLPLRPARVDGVGNVSGHVQANGGITTTDLSRMASSSSFWITLSQSALVRDLPAEVHPVFASAGGSSRCHSTHAHSADAVPTDAKRSSATTTSEALRASCIISPLPSRWADSVQGHHALQFALHDRVLVAADGARFAHDLMSIWYIASASATAYRAGAIEVLS